MDHQRWIQSAFLFLTSKEVNKLSSNFIPCAWNQVRIILKLRRCFTAISDAFKSDDLDWDNAFSVGLNNTVTNMGSRNSFRTKILAENLQTFIAGCNCHLRHLTPGNRDEAYASISKFDCEDQQVHLHYIL